MRKFCWHPFMLTHREHFKSTFLDLTAGAIPAATLSPHPVPRCSLVLLVTTASIQRRNVASPWAQLKLSLCYAVDGLRKCLSDILFLLHMVSLSTVCLEWGRDAELLLCLSRSQELHIQYFVLVALEHLCRWNFLRATKSQIIIWILISYVSLANSLGLLLTSS